MNEKKPAEALSMRAKRRYKMQKEVTFSESGEELIAKLSGELDHHQAKKYAWK